jgi:hypothetical protein
MITPTRFDGLHGLENSGVALRYMHGNEEAQRAAITARGAQLTLNRQ